MYKKHSVRSQNLSTNYFFSFFPPLACSKSLAHLARSLFNRLQYGPHSYSSVMLNHAHSLTLPSRCPSLLLSNPSSSSSLPCQLFPTSSSPRHQQEQNQKERSCDGCTGVCWCSQIDPIQFTSKPGLHSSESSHVQLKCALRWKRLFMVDIMVPPCKRSENRRNRTIGIVSLSPSDVDMSPNTCQTSFFLRVPIYLSKATPFSLHMSDSTCSHPSMPTFSQVESIFC